MPDENQVKINEILQFRTGIIKNNYSQIKSEYENHYILPEIDPVRGEICHCIMFGFYQAAITLTNHLFEKSMRLFLLVDFSKKEDNNTDSEESGIIKKIISAFRPSHLQLKDKDLSYLINKSCSEGIITKEQKKVLHEFRDKFRNAYGHADADKTFGSSTISVSGMKLDGNNNIVSDPPQVNLIAQLLPIQGLLQVKFAEMEAIPYFKSLDEIIRHAKFIVIPSAVSDPLNP